MKEQIIGVGTSYGDAAFRIFHFSLRPLPEALSKSHTHQYYEILCCTGDSVCYLIENDTITLKKNQLIIVPPNVPHFRMATADNTDTVEAISFSLSEQKGRTGFYRAFEEALQRHMLTPTTYSPKLLERIQSINHEDWNGSLQSYCRLKSLVPAFIFELFDVLDAFSLEEHSGGMDRDREDILVLLDNLLNNRALSLKDIAGRINYSERHTARLIRKHYQTTLSELRKKQKE